MSAASSRPKASPPLKGAFARIHALIRKIPAGKVRTYGELAASAEVSVRTVVWALHQCPGDVPWHRVVGKDGLISLAARSPLLGAEQASRLAKEGWRIENWKLSRPGGRKQARKSTAETRGE